MGSDKVQILLGKDEALVLFELLSEYGDQPKLDIKGSAERLALLRLHGALEQLLVEPFMPNYRDLIEQAATRLVSEA